MANILEYLDWRGDLTLDQLTELVKVHLVVIGEGGDDGNAGTGKNGVTH